MNYISRQAIVLAETTDIDKIREIVAEIIMDASMDSSIRKEAVDFFKDLEDEKDRLRNT